tara:strand:- start:228 stop:974 length:747 start_codon:yes stop_codon:yes gene_type:complete
MAYQAPLMTSTNIRARPFTLMGWDSSDSDRQAQVYEALTAAATAACKWNNYRWWFMRKDSTFPTVSGTASYDLTTVNSNAMADMDYPTSVWWQHSTTSRARLDLISFDEYADRAEAQTTGATSTAYALYGGNFYLHPEPNAVKTISVYYMRKHGLINATTAATDFIIPGEFHRPLYVDGACWLLRHATVDPMALYQSPAFVEALNRMAANAPDEQDPTNVTRLQEERELRWPNHQRVFPDGRVYIDDV